MTHLSPGLSHDTLKVDFMVKRSQLRSRWKVENYKNRWFILKPKFMSYHDGELSTGANKEKGRVGLNNVLAVEEVDSEALGSRPNAFQIVYKDNMVNVDADIVVLYIVATHRQQRSEWIDAIRRACDDCGAEFASTYHPGVWARPGRYTCCDSFNRRVGGCKPTTFTGSRKSQSLNDAMNNMSIPDSSSRGHVAVRNSEDPVQPRVPPKRDELLRTPKETQKKYVIALYDYHHAEAGDLSLMKGDQYEILDDKRPHWWLAKDKTGDIGYIPANYVEEVTDDGLENYDWYYKNTTREKSTQILKKEGKEGGFLVRDSSVKGMYTLSIFTRESNEPQVKHYHIKKNAEGNFYLAEKHAFKTIPELIYYHKHNCAGCQSRVLHYRIGRDDLGQYFISREHTFPTVPSLVSFHKHNTAGLIVRLRSPPIDRSSTQPTTAGFGHDMFEIDPSELELFELLGTGQFGTVKRARWRGDIDVAVKMLHPESMSEDDFIDEARTMKQLQNPHLVQLYGVSTTRRPLYLITEYMKHGSLLHYIRRNKQELLVQPVTLLDICVQVAEGMEYLEANGYIHRDLAARNCLVTDNCVVKVGDFGLARFVLDDEYRSSSGTKFPIKWSPPEVLSYTTFSSKSDVWAYGVLMWEVYTGGDMPYGRSRNPEVVDLVCHKKKRLEQPPSCSTPVYSIMYSCWSELPEKRPTFANLFDCLKTMQEENRVDYVQ